MLLRLWLAAPQPAAPQPAAPQPAAPQPATRPATKVRLGLLLCMLILGLPLRANAASIAIIIDDMGHNLALGELAIEVPANLTYAILPHTQHARHLAELANQRGKEVMLHMPMANLGRQPLGPGGLTRSLSHRQFQANLAQALAEVPHVRGVNNHMGSELTQSRTQMDWLMTTLKQRQLYFVDSRTTHKSVAAQSAAARELLHTSRDIFLDNEPSFYAIDRAFAQLLKKARASGTAVAIGHPYRTTLDYLAMVTPQLASQGIKVVSASRLIALRRAASFNATVASLQSPQPGPAYPHKSPDQ